MKHKNRLLKYEFWGEEGEYYGKLFRHIPEPELTAMREYVASQILRTKFCPLRWLDVGSGNGYKLSDVIQLVRKKERGLKIELTAVEPSKYPLNLLSKRLISHKNISLKIINRKFSLNLLRQNSFDVITFFHSNYYIANTSRSFEIIYSHAYQALRPGGTLLVQSVAEESDFQKLGHPHYSDWSLGERVYKIFKRVCANVVIKKFPTHFDVTHYLRKLSLSSKKELLHFYRFVTQKEKISLSQQAKEELLRRIRQLSRQKREKYYLDFRDCVVSARKK